MVSLTQEGSPTLSYCFECIHAINSWRGRLWAQTEDEPCTSRGKSSLCPHSSVAAPKGPLPRSPTLGAPGTPLNFSLLAVLSGWGDPE